MAMASPSGDQEVEQREEGERWAQVCGGEAAPTPLYEEGGAAAPIGYAGPKGCPHLSPLHMSGASTHAHSCSYSMGGLSTQKTQMFSSLNE